MSVLPPPRHWGSTRAWRARLLPALLLTLLAAVATPAWPVGAAEGPQFTLSSTAGPCLARPEVRGTGWVPGATIYVSSYRTIPVSEKGEGQRIAEATVGADGTFSVILLTINGDCIDLDRRTPEGTRYQLLVGYASPSPCECPPLEAFFTIRRPDARQRLFPETGVVVHERFLDYWERHGGLAINGYPLSSEFPEQLEDGKVYMVQYFERTRMEWHPEQAAPYDVLLGQFGRRIHPADQPSKAIPGQRFFPETGHNLGGTFRTYWEANGGLAQFGYPLTEEYDERLEDGKVYRVQYFERARFEHHPENGAPWNVLLGHFGRRILAEAEPIPHR